MRPTVHPALIVAILGLVFLGGCTWKYLESQEAPQPTTPTTPLGASHVEAAPHSAGVQSAGDYHVEAQLSASGSLTLYIYGAKEKQVSPISLLALDLGMEATAKIAGEGDVSIPLTARPFATDPDGTSARFVGRFDRRSDQKEVGLELTLPIDGQTYRLQWRPEYLLPGATLPVADTMPQAVSSEAARTLFLTPGGLYTEADIIANGRKTATEKYGSVMSAHNAHPKPGDRLCPISETLANLKFTWIVGGKTYRFCCPPCIEEFVARAKSKPATIKEPEAYVQPT